MDKDMYFQMKVEDSNLVIDRGMALHKMIRFITIATGGGGYLNFMGNEFGHPEWIDFPRAGNNWSYKHATRQWSLVDRFDLKYKFLNAFDEQIVKLVSSKQLLDIFPCNIQKINEPDNIISFSRSDLIFVFNFHPTQSYTDYGIPVKDGKYKFLFSSDDLKFGGFGRYDENQIYHSSLITPEDNNYQIKLYIPARTAVVLEKMPIPKVFSRLKSRRG
jgi:1,4-alpha-glucan branching enzyme